MTTWLGELRCAARTLLKQSGFTLVAVVTLALAIDAMVRSLWQPRLFSWIFSAFSLVALVLAVVGVYGVVSYSVAQRTREIGIRVALGADRRRIRATVLRQGARAASIGIGVGLLGAAAVTRLMRALLYGTSPTDPVTDVLVTVLLAVTVLVACLVPAWRATRIDPIVALRYH